MDSGGGDKAVLLKKMTIYNTLASYCEGMFVPLIHCALSDEEWNLSK